MWSSERSVVKAAWKNLVKGENISAEFGLPPVDIPVGPWPVADTCGFQIAIEILRALQNPGRNDASYTQFNSARKLRSAYLTAYESGPERCLDNFSFISGEGQFSAVINSKTQLKLIC